MFALSAVSKTILAAADEREFRFELELGESDPAWLSAGRTGHSQFDDDSTGAKPTSTDEFRRRQRS